MTSKGSKLIAIALVAIVVAAGFGYWLLAPKVPSQLVTYTTQQTSLLTLSEQTHRTSAFSTTSMSGTTLWINVSATQPVSYYLALLESSGTEPYVTLSKELRKIPDLTNGTAVAQIVYLALNGSISSGPRGPEVEEALRLFLKGGTPRQSDFGYAVPKYNTELQVLYWLAGSSQFKRDDTLALAVAMSNGLWVTIGDEQVKQAVKKDAIDLLAFFRETNELQRQKGYSALEDYPLEAKVCLAYTSSIGTIDGSHSLWRFTEKRATEKDYRWVRYDVTALRKMRDIALVRGWVEGSVESSVKNFEEYFYFSGFAEHWTYSTKAGDIPGVTESLIEVDGEMMTDHWIYNLQFYLKHFLETGRGLGDCGDETYFMEAWSKSWGIATTFMIHQIIVNGEYHGHAHMTYYDPETRTWKAYSKQVDTAMLPAPSHYIFMFRPPVKQSGYFAFSPIKDTRFGNSGTVYVLQETNAEFKQTFLAGCPANQMKQWLLYS